MQGNIVRAEKLWIQGKNIKFVHACSIMSPRKMFLKTDNSGYVGEYIMRERESREPIW